MAQASEWEDDEHEQIEEIDYLLYLTPPNPMRDREIDPMVELARMEAEIEERERQERERQERESAAPSARSERLRLRRSARLDSETEALPGEDASDDSSTEDAGDSQLDDQKAPTVQFAEQPSSFDDSPEVAIAADRSCNSREGDDELGACLQDANASIEASSPTIDVVHNQAETHDDCDNEVKNDGAAVEDEAMEEDDAVEIVWSGRAPPWLQDPSANTIDALLIHACGCDAVTRCRDVEFRGLCSNMKRFLRVACWASHHSVWSQSRAARALANLLAYHSIHCTRPPFLCDVPLCCLLRC